MQSQALAQCSSGARYWHALSFLLFAFQVPIKKSRAAS